MVHAAQLAELAVVEAGEDPSTRARALEVAGAAVCVRQESADAVRIARELGRLLGDAALRTRMADAARAHGRPTAAVDVAKDLLLLAGLPLAVRVPLNGMRHVNGKGTRPHPEVN